MKQLATRGGSGQTRYTLKEMLAAFSGYVCGMATMVQTIAAPLTDASYVNQSQIRNIFTKLPTAACTATTEASAAATKMTARTATA